MSKVSKFRNFLEQNGFSASKKGKLQIHWIPKSIFSHPKIIIFLNPPFRSQCCLVMSVDGIESGMMSYKDSKASDLI